MNKQTCKHTYTVVDNIYVLFCLLFFHEMYFIAIPIELPHFISNCSVFYFRHNIFILTH
jgi:hypothetical protein